MVDKVSFKERLCATDALEIVSVPIFKDINMIKIPSTDATIEEAEKIWPILEKSLDPKLGYGLSACQIGVHKRIGYIRYNGKEYRLLNTRIIDRSVSTTIMYGEGCLSLPGKVVNTVRHTQITVEDDIQGKLILTESDDALLCIIFQHEIDHFDGITILDRKQIPIINKEKKIGRNDLCPCGSGKKYKNCCLNKDEA